jgi:hypothetical protein
MGFIRSSDDRYRFYLPYTFSVMYYEDTVTVLYITQRGKGETPVLWSTGGVQRSTSGVQAEYGGVLEYRSLAFSPLILLNY